MRSDTGWIVERSAEPATDDDLLAAWQRGDRSAGKQLYRRHVGAVTRFMRNKLPDLETVKELVGDTFVEVVKSVGGRRATTAEEQRIVTFEAYVLGVARHVFLKHLRHKYHRPQIDLHRESIDQVAPGSLSSIISRVREIDVLVRALRALPIADQMLLEAKWFEYLSDADLAHVLQIPASTLPGRIRGAKRRLLAEIERQRRVHGDTPVGGVPAALDAWVADLRAEIARTNPAAPGTGE